MDAQAISSAIAKYFRETPVPLVCAYMFGSQARGEQRRGSDVDIAVLLPAGSVARVTGPLSVLRGDLERLLRRPVDLIDLRRAPVDLIHRILRDGQLLVERNRGERVAFEVRARNEYFDLLPHLRRYRQGRAA